MLTKPQAPLEQSGYAQQCYPLAPRVCTEELFYAVVKRGVKGRIAGHQSEPWHIEIDHKNRLMIAANQPKVILLEKQG